MSRSALLTGATGFIGSRLAKRLLASGWRVHALLRSESREEGLADEIVLHRHDGTLEALTSILSSSRPDMVFHLASLYLAEHQPEQIDDLISSNILFPVQLAEAMVATGAKRLINTGTAWQHFETECYNPVNLYAATKQACSDLLQYYYSASDMSILTLKLFDTYGAGDKRRKLIQLLVDAAVTGERLAMSPGEQVIDLTHVEDVNDAFLAAAERLLAKGNPSVETFFVSGERLSVRELVATVGAALGRHLEVEFGARLYRNREVMLPLEVKASDLLPGWQVRRTLMQSLPDLVREDPGRRGAIAVNAAKITGFGQSPRD